MTLGEKIAATATAVVLITLPIALVCAIYDSRQQRLECAARGGVMARDLGCVDLKKIRP